LQTYDLFAPALTLADRYSLFAKMRSEPGLCRVEPFGAYAAARYEDAAAILKAPRRFSSEALAVTAEPAWLGPNPVAHSLVSMDPPRHTPLRALITRAFGPTGIARLEAQVRRVSEELAEAAVRQGEVELVDAFTFVLPRNIIGAMLGLSGTKVPAGSLVLGLVGSANHDERVFEHPERFLPGRDKGTQHLSFGYGVHFCLGAQLARMEARLGLEALVSRIRGLRLCSPQVQWLPGFTLHGPAVLPVELLPA